jgi:outer membrane protein assembly factor BamB
VGTALYHPCFLDNASLLDAASGRLLWSKQDVGSYNMALANGMLYGWFGLAGNSNIGALVASNGNVAWADNEGPYSGAAVSDAITANGVVYTGLSFFNCSAGTGQSYVVAVDGSNGNLLWAYQFAGSDPCITGYNVVPSALVDGTLYVVRTPDGATGELWAFRQP